MQPVSPALAQALHAYRFPVEVRFANARAALDDAAREIDSLRDSPRDSPRDSQQLRFDLSACEHFDSSLLAILLELVRRAGALGRRCEMLDPPQNLLKLAGLYGVDELLFGTLRVR